MPELPEVETVVRTLESRIKGQKIESVEVVYPRICDNCSHEDFKQKLCGQHFNDFARRGKYLLFYLDEYVLIAHLRMEGKFFIYDKNRQGFDKHTHVIFNLTDCQLHYNDVRKFGRFYLYDKAAELTCLDKLGFEPFDENLTGEYLKRYSRNVTTEIKTLLLDQGMICGIGNIYADEICFRSSISPFKPAKYISETDYAEIIQAGKDILTQAIKLGGTTIRSYTSSLNVTGRFQQNLMVHKRENEPCCKCGSLIERVKLHGRSTYYCPNCQMEKTVKVAISGSMGSGKSTVMDYLHQVGYKTISCDAINAELLKKTKVQESLAEILNIDKAGFTKEVMAEIIFNDKAIKAKAEKYLHQLILDEVNDFIGANQTQKFVFVEVPLLFESGWNSIFDYNILIYSDDQTVIERIKASRSISEQQIKLRLASQMSVEEKLTKADYSINNSGSRSELLKQVDKLLNILNK